MLVSSIPYSLPRLPLRPRLRLVHRCLRPVGGAARCLVLRVHGLSLRRELFTRQTDAARQGEAFIYEARRERGRRAVPRRPGEPIRVHPRDGRDALRFGRVAEAAGRGRA